ncbi:MAG: hypothetical protein FWE14_13110, partial [Lachnospiraceae bacterium]|nr:hypothetical protein [Lachnospiraceae bacterium]
SAVLLTFGHMNPLLCLLGILSFNMTMPVTLCAVASVLPYNPGLAFGIATLALLCGNVPTFFIMATNVPVVFAALAACSIASLYYVLDGRGREYEEIQKN